MERLGRIDLSWDVGARTLKSLDPGDLAILKALWENLYESNYGSSRSHRPEGMTRDELTSKLVGPEPEKPFRTSGAMYKHLANLKLLTETVVTFSVRTSKGVGKHRDVYTLARDQAIVWPSTARIVMEVWDAPGHHISEEGLIQRMSSIQLRRESHGRPLEPGDIALDIKYAISTGYLDRYSSDVRAAERLRFEVGYVNAIAERCLSGSNKEETERGWR
jgi:hypothetical protein